MNYDISKAGKCCPLGLTVTYTGSVLELFQGYSYWWFTSGNTQGNYFRPVNYHTFSMSAGTSIKYLSKRLEDCILFLEETILAPNSNPLSEPAQGPGWLLPDKGTICLRLTLPVNQLFLCQRLHLKSNWLFRLIFRWKQRIPFTGFPTQGESVRALATQSG